MTLFQATLFTGILLLAFGAHFLWHGMRSAKSVQAFPRSQTAAYILLGSAAVWFLYKVTQLGPADFGQYKNLLFILFLVVALGSFIFVPDFLAVRGLAALMLLTAGALLAAGYIPHILHRLHTTHAACCMLHATYCTYCTYCTYYILHILRTTHAVR